VTLQRRTFTTGSYSVEHFYLCHYRPKNSAGHDRLSQSLLNFKNGIEPDVRAWIECSVAELKKTFLGSKAVTVRALDHLETKPLDSSAMQQLCTRLEKQIGLKNATSALSKKQPTKKLSMLSRRHRFTETSGVYEVNSNSLPSDRILVVDDILTSGATMSAIINAIKQVKPKASLKLFTFAFSEHYSDINDSLFLKGGQYGWTQTGWKLQEDVGAYMDSFEDLSRRILDDNF
jgi:hypothetical protein